MLSRRVFSEIFKIWEAFSEFLRGSGTHWSSRGREVRAGVAYGGTVSTISCVRVSVLRCHTFWLYALGL